MFFSEFNGLAVWGSAGLTNRDNIPIQKSFLGETKPLRYGFELLLGPYPAEEPSEATAQIQSRLDSLDTMLFFESLDTGNPTRTIAIRKRMDELEVALEESRRRDSLDRCRAWTMEMGIGYEFSDSFQPGNDSISVRLPISGIYLSAYVQLPSAVSVAGEGYYLGASAGLYDLSQATAYTTGTNEQFEMTSSAFSFDIVPFGAYWAAGSMTFFLELTYKYLAFDAIRYVPVIEGAIPPSNAPRRIDPSGWYLTFGIQLAKGGL